MQKSESNARVPRTLDKVSNAELEAVEAACRVLVAISAQSIAAVEHIVDLAQFRALVVVASRGSVSLGELAEASNTHLSTASRICERLVTANLLHRTDDPANRRQLILTLTPKGRRLVQDVMRRRRAALASVVERLPRKQRGQLVSLLQVFAARDGEDADKHLWFLGWPT